MKNVVINGRVLLLPTNGIPRYATEIIRYIDSHIPKEMKIEVVIPKGSSPRLELKNIKYITLPNRFAWDYISAERYAKKKKALYVNMASKGTVYKNSIATIFDIRPISYDSKPKDFRSLKYYLKFKISFTLAALNAKRLVTISEFCKREILQHCNRNDSEIEVIGCGWDHIHTITEDNSVFVEHPEIKRGDFLLSIGSVAPHKNFKWIINNARHNPHEQYVIVGKTDTSLWLDTTNEFSKNIVYLGYQTDEKLKALLINSKALIFPSLYEGFGIPPLEAAGSGIRTVVSDIPVMREIMKDNTIYIDPLNYDYNIEALISNSEKKDEMWLKSFTWESQGCKWIELLSREAKSV